MPVMLLDRKKGRIGIGIVCDVCNKEITDLRDGNVEGLESRRPCGVRFTHKKCAVHTRPRGGWMELQSAAVYLANTLEVTGDEWKTAEEITRRLSEVS